MNRSILAVIMAAMMLTLPACSGGPKPTPTATPPIGMGEATFADGRGLRVGFKLLYALDGSGGNGVLGTTTLSAVLAAVKYGAAGDTAGGLAEELGMKGMQPRQVNDLALRMRQAVGKLKTGRYVTAWCMIYGEKQYIRESYYADCKQTLQLQMNRYQPADAESNGKYLGEWADENTGGRIKKLDLSMPSEPAPFFVDLLTADPDWELALDTGKTRPLPFRFENGDENAVPTMVCSQKCGIFESAQGSLAVLPLAGDETRLVVMFPPEDMTLHEFIPVAAAKHDEWLAAAEWASQRVLIPRVRLDFSGSMMPVLDRAGLGGLLGKDADYGALGEDLHFSDVLHMASLTIDESGVGNPDPDAVYRPGIKDGIRTLAVDRPFLVLLERTDPDTGFGQVLMMGFVRDPLAAAPN